MEVPDGKVVSLLGANGAGKTTTLKSISGLLYTELGEVTRGKILWGEKAIQGIGPENVVKAGIVQVLEGRPIFEHLTVEENIRIGAAVFLSPPYHGRWESWEPPIILFSWSYKLVKRKTLGSKKDMSI